MHRGCPVPAAQFAYCILLDPLFMLTCYRGSSEYTSMLLIIVVLNIAFCLCRGLVNAEYSGNFLSDVYFALWKLSNDFFVERVYGSSCGNFGSNATLPWQLWQGECLDGTVQDKTLTGRDASLLQKKYFGGLSMSQDIFDWATIPGSSLHKVFISSPHSTARRQRKHYIMCGHDTMSHDMQGERKLQVLNYHHS